MTNEQRDAEAVLECPNALNAASQASPACIHSSASLDTMTQPPQNTAHARSTQHQKHTVLGHHLSTGRAGPGHCLTSAVASPSFSPFSFFATAPALSLAAAWRFSLADNFGGSVSLPMVPASRTRFRLPQTHAQPLARRQQRRGGSSYARRPPRSAHPPTRGAPKQGTGLHAVQMRRRQPARHDPRQVCGEMAVKHRATEGRRADRSLAPPHAAAL
jgi:hypothetical protein